MCTAAGSMDLFHINNTKTDLRRQTTSSSPADRWTATSTRATRTGAVFDPLPLAFGTHPGLIFGGEMADHRSETFGQSDLLPEEDRETVREGVSQVRGS